MLHDHVGGNYSMVRAGTDSLWWESCSSVPCPYEVYLALVLVSSTGDWVSLIYCQRHSLRLCPLEEFLSSRIMVVVYVPGLVVYMEVPYDDASEFEFDAVEVSFHVEWECRGWEINSVGFCEAYGDLANVSV